MDCNNIQVKQYFRGIFYLILKYNIHTLYKRLLINGITPLKRGEVYNYVLAKIHCKLLLHLCPVERAYQGLTLCFISEQAEQAQTPEQNCEYKAVEGIDTRPSTYVTCTWMDSFPTGSTRYLKR